MLPSLKGGFGMKGSTWSHLREGHGPRSDAAIRIFRGSWFSLCLHFLPETPGEASQERKGLSDPGAQLGMIVPG